MIGIYSIGGMPSAVEEVDTEMPLIIVPADGIVSMGHSIHGGCHFLSVNLHNDGFPLPAPGAVDSPHHLCICGGQGLYIGMKCPSVTIDIKGEFAVKVCHLGNGAPGKY